MYLQDSITYKNWVFNLGLRGDIYDGISGYNLAQPRVGVAYNVKRTNTILRASYARIMETPFNENLVIASTGCRDAVINAIATGAQGYPCLTSPLKPSWRNEFHTGFQQAVGKYLVVDAEYIWKYTHYGYDFSIFINTPILFPVEWHNSKIPEYAVRASVPEFHGFTALVVMSSVATRFFRPQVAPRNLFDLAFGQGNLFRGDRYVINLTNKTALYKFLSTFSGTHYVTPRTLTGEIGFHF